MYRYGLNSTYERIKNIDKGWGPEFNLKIAQLYRIPNWISPEATSIFVNFHDFEFQVQWRYRKIFEGVPTLDPLETSLSYISINIFVAFC